MQPGELNVTIMRGGTSKGVFILQEDFDRIPRDAREATLLSLLGSPDSRQIDGLGGGSSTTSKVMLVARGTRDGVDIEYTFVQVAVDQPVVDYGGTSGNLTAAVALYSVEEGLVRRTGASQQIRMWNRNTQKLVIAEVHATDDKASCGRGGSIADRSGCSRVATRHVAPVGGVTGALFPTGRRSEKIAIVRGQVTCSILDVVNPIVFVRASEMGLRGTESPAEINENGMALKELEQVRSSVAELLGIVATARCATEESPGIPKIAVVAEPVHDALAEKDGSVESDANVCVRSMSMQKAHPAQCVSGAMGAAVAAWVPGTVVAEVAVLGAPALHSTARRTVIDYPGGQVEVQVEFGTRGPDSADVKEISVVRTARRLMRGVAYLRR